MALQLTSPFSPSLLTVCCVYRLYSRRRICSGDVCAPTSLQAHGTAASLYLLLYAEADSCFSAQSLFAFSAFFGTGFGPCIFGYVAQNLGWRWIQYIQVRTPRLRAKAREDSKSNRRLSQIILGGLCTIALVHFIKETRGK